MTLATVGFERYAKTTRRAAFLAEMERVVPWSALCALIEPFYPKPGKGRHVSGDPLTCELIREIMEHESTHGQCTQTFIKKVRKQIRPKA